ncbi:MAG: hypothetical protein RL701_4481 [Pseudomonadota bacterium]
MNAAALELTANHRDPYPIGAVIADRYELRRVLGRGGAAVVFAAEHILVRRPVALKLPLLHPELLELLAARLRCETQALARVRHPAIVDIIDAGEHDDMPFLAMELLEGRTLTGLIAARGRLDADDVVKIGVDLAEGLAAVHAAGVLHRDVKPANVLITRGAHNQIHLCDFGVARLQEPAGALDQRLTQAGAILGTPEYMSLEAFVSGAESDHRLDIFALGISLYECLTGAVPVEGAIGAILRQRSLGVPPPLQELRPDLTPQLCGVINRCLAQDPFDRFATMTELAAALRGCTRKQLDVIDLLRAASVAPAIQQDRASALSFTARRSHARAPYVTLATLQRVGGPTSDARIEDVSEGGVLLVAREPYAQFEAVRLRFALPISGKVFALNAVVRWCRTARGIPATGVEFTELPEAARVEIRQYVALMSNARPPQR